MLPIPLTRYFADSQLVLESFAREDQILVIRIEKEIGPETGLIRFAQVSFVCLPIAMAGEAIHARSIGEADSSFWFQHPFDQNDFESDDVLFELVSQDGPVHMVVAKSIRYDIIG